jgi:hypothetical protein
MKMENIKSVMLAPGSYTLTVTYVGYTTYTQDIAVGSSAMTANVTMKADYQNLSEVVVRKVMERSRLRIDRINLQRRI